ncbi:MAG: SIR2 family protein, partial [Gammaproteobacteria bacterium]
MPAPRDLTPTFDEDAWDDLLNYIEERRVIPIIGPDLLRVQTDTGLQTLYGWLAGKLAARLSVDPGELPQPLTLNDVMCGYLGQHGRREEAYTRVRSIMREARFEPPQALRQLARITDFELFVTTTFDPLLATALNLERYGGQPGTEVIAYTPNRVADLPSELAELKRTVVYHLLGRLSASPTYVLFDEDMLEYVCALQSEHLNPEKLFHELEHNHLLLIGSHFSNWLARLFLRMAKRKRLSDPRDVTEIFADDHTAKDARLVAFLQQVSVRTRVYGGAESFIAELYRRWSARQEPAQTPQGRAAPQRFLPPTREMPENAIFISYAREDLPAVQRLKAAMDAAGLTT